MVNISDRFDFKKMKVKESILLKKRSFAQCKLLNRLEPNIFFKITHFFLSHMHC